MLEKRHDSELATAELIAILGSRPVSTRVDAIARAVGVDVAPGLRSPDLRARLCGDLIWVDERAPRRTLERAVARELGLWALRRAGRPLRSDVALDVVRRVQRALRARARLAWVRPALAAHAAVQA